jgi:hypothetical protein
VVNRPANKVLIQAVHHTRGYHLLDTMQRLDTALVSKREPTKLRWVLEDIVRWLPAILFNTKTNPAT